MLNLQKKTISTIEDKCKEGFPIYDGPFICCLNERLSEMNIHREAYYGGTFTGNNAHRFLKVNV